VIYSGTPLFHSVAAPILKSNGSGALRTFVLARKKYLAQVAERKAQPCGSELQPQSLLVSIDPGLLESLVLLRTFRADITRTTSVQDDHVTKWLDAVADRQSETFSKADLTLALA
jgi:hypothetical protein